jgi:hypothetical protein
MDRRDYRATTESDQTDVFANHLSELERSHLLQSLQLAEVEADPHSTDLLKEESRKHVESLEARLKVLHAKAVELGFAETMKKQQDRANEQKPEDFNG